MPSTLTVSVVIGIAIGAMVPAYISAYKTALHNGSWLQIAKNAGIAWAKWFGIGLGIVILLPYVAAVAVKLAVIFGLSKATATLAVSLMFLGLFTSLLAKGMYNIWSSNLPVRVKIGLTGLVALSIYCIIGKGGINKIVSNAKTILKHPNQISQLMKDSPYQPTEGRNVIDIAKVNQYANTMRNGQWNWSKMAKTDPIIVDQNGAIMSGHHRIIAATLAGEAIPASAIKIYPGLTARPLFNWDGAMMPD